MSSNVYKSLTLKWNRLSIVQTFLGLTYGIHTQQIHLASYVKQIFGKLSQIRSRHQYNVYYRAVGNELQKQSVIQNRSLFDLFLQTASFDSMKTKWASLLDYAYANAYSEKQFRTLLYAMNKAYKSRPSPASIKLALQQMAQIDSNRLQVYEYWRDFAKMTTFTLDWLLRNDAVFLTTGSVTSSGATSLISAALTSYDDDSLAGYTVIITSGAATGDIRKIVSNIKSTGQITVNSAWSSNPIAASTFTVSLFKSQRNDILSLRPDSNYYNSFGLTPYGFQVWISVDDYLNVLNFIGPVVRKIRQAYTVFSIAYIVHAIKTGSLTAALIDPTKNPVYVAVGTGDPSWDPYGPQPTGTETDLYAEIYRTIGLINYINPDETPSSVPTDYLEITGFFPPGFATSPRIMEAGIFAEDGVTLLKYSAFVRIEKISTDAFMWKVRLKYDSL